MAERTKAVIILTSHDRLGNTERRTGFHWEELAVPYYVLLSRGFDVEIASIKGGAAPADPTSLAIEGERPMAVERFLADRAAMAKLYVTRHVDEIRPQDYALVFLPGGHGTMWDLPEDATLAGLLTRAWRNGAVIGAVCHGPAGLLGARDTTGKPLVAGRHVSAFTDEEERAVRLDGVVPFLLETRLTEAGAIVDAGAPFEPKLVRDGRLVTGQNPASAKAVADEMVATYAQSRAEAA